MVEPRSSKFLNSNVVRLAVADSRRSALEYVTAAMSEGSQVSAPGAPGRSRRRQGTTESPRARSHFQARPGWSTLDGAAASGRDVPPSRSTALPERSPSGSTAASDPTPSSSAPWRPLRLHRRGLLRRHAGAAGRVMNASSQLGGPADATLTRSILPSKFAGSTHIIRVSFAPPSPNGLADCPCFGECGWLDGRAGYEPSTRTARDMLRSAGQSTVELGTYSTMATSSGCDCTTAWIGTAPVLLR